MNYWLFIRLVRMVAANRAMYFHQKVCTHCQRFPGLQSWLSRPSPGSIEVRPCFTKIIAPSKLQYLPHSRWATVWNCINIEKYKYYIYFRFFKTKSISIRFERDHMSSTIFQIKKRSEVTTLKIHPNSETFSFLRRSKRVNLWV